MIETEEGERKRIKRDRGARERERSDTSCRLRLAIYMIIGETRLSGECIRIAVLFIRTILSANAELLELIQPSPTCPSSCRHCCHQVKAS